MKKLLLFTLTSLIPFSMIAQVKSQQATEKESEKEDMIYEIKHKNSSWFRRMNQPGANYFEVKKEFDRYFGTHKWEKSKPRELGEGWIKSKIFYLDKNGIVQDAPAFNPTARKYSPSLNPPGVTTRDVGTWHMIGPVNTQSPNGNEGGYVVLTRLDPTDPLKIFSSFQWGGLWVTTDAGVSWTLTDANMIDEPYNDLDVAISNPLIVYAISASHVIKSTDGGLTWATTTLTSAGYPGKAYDIAVSPANPNIVIARWGDKVYRTADGGVVWTQILSGLPDYDIWEGLSSEMLDWSLTDNNVVYLLSTSSNSNNIVVYRSGDAGATFSILTTLTVDPAANGQIVGWGKIFQSSNNTNEFYVGMGTGDDHYSHHAVTLYKLNRTTGAEVLKRVNMIPGISTDELHHGDIAMDKVDENRIAYGTYGQYAPHYSTNNGISFTYSVSFIHADQRSFDMKNNRLVMGNDGQTALSTDGGITNAGITNTISNHELWGFGAAFKSATTVAGTNHGPAMVRESGSGFEWTTLSGADQGNTDVNPLDERYVYSQGYDNYLYFRTGFGTFIQIANLLDEGGIYSYFNNFEFHPNLYYSLVTHHAGAFPFGNPNLAIWKNSLIRSDDNGATVSIVKTFTDQLFREKICMTNPNYIYAVVGLTNNKVWKTTDGGVNWTDVTPTSGESSGQTNISDVAVSDVDPNQVWITYSGVQTVCKVLKSANGGTSWTNLTQPVLSANPNTKIIFQRGSDGGVYVGNKSGVYYKNNSMPNWVMLGNGLPSMEIRYMFINYNLGKLRIGTSRGGWENDLYETSPPKAQISANTNKVVCTSSDVIQFKDYSTVRNASATWAWSFPGGTPATSTLENPVVSYTGAANGFYNVSLTVTDAFGTSSQTLNNFIQVDGTDCAIDTIPGKLLTLTNPGDYSQQGSAQNITTNTITLSCWIKPNGVQSANSGIIFSGSNGATGMSYNGTGTLGYTWQDDPGSYNFNSGLTIPVNVWSHVALVVSATSATLYLNGVPATRTAAHSAVNFDQVFQFGIDRSNTGRNFKGQMDEICIYNRALSTDEIRELMNLTRNNPNAGSLPANDPSLISYYQFNEGAGKPGYDKVGGKHANLAGGAIKTDASTAPLGGGTFQRLNITTGGLKDFVAPAVEITFPASGTYPDGDVVVTRLNVPSDQLASMYVLPATPKSYYVIRNYGNNSSFSALTAMKFKNVQGITGSMVTTPASLKLYKRLSNDDGATWGSSIDDADIVTNNSGTGTVEFNTGLTNTGFSQFSIGSTSPPLPVQLLSFSAQNIKDKEALLNWETAQEMNLKGYQIDRSADGLNFFTIGFVSATGRLNYTFSDVHPLYGKNYYRLKMIDIDGRFKYSGIKNIDIKSEVILTLGPNPSHNGKLNFMFTGLKMNTGLSMSVTNAMGELIKTSYLSNVDNNSRFMTGLGSSVPGIYFVQITLTTGQRFLEKVILVK